LYHCDYVISEEKFGAVCNGEFRGIWEKRRLTAIR
jgi:hypothetical protein